MSPDKQPTYELEELRDELRRHIERGGISVCNFFIIDQLRELGTIDAARIIVEALVIGDSIAAAHVQYALFALGEKSEVACKEVLDDPQLEEINNIDHPKMTRALSALSWLSAFNGESNRDLFLDLATSKNKFLRSHAIYLLARLEINWEYFTSALSDTSSEVRRSAAYALTPRVKSSCFGLKLKPRWVDGSRDARDGGYAFDPDCKIKGCPQSKKVQFPDDTVMFGSGNWETVSVIESALLRESDKYAIEALTTSYLHLVFKFCPTDEILLYSKKIGELFFSCFDGWNFRCGFEIKNYLEFCNRGNLDYVEPIYLILKSEEGKNYIHKIKEMYIDLYTNKMCFFKGEDNSEYRMLTRLLTYALDKVNEQWSDDLLTEIYKAGRPDLWFLLGDDKLKQKISERFDSSSVSKFDPKYGNNKKAWWQFWK